MEYPKYNEYLDSTIDWLGRVPNHWIVKKIKWDSAVLRGASPRPIDDPAFFDDNGKYAWVRIADVTASGKHLEKTTQRLSKLGASLSVKIKPENIFLSIAGSVGKPCISKIDCCIHDGFVYFPYLKINHNFLYYIFASGEPYKGLGKFGTQLNLNTETVGSISIAIPSETEQESIIRFLDKETTRINNLIEKKLNLIHTLNENRIAIISHAVTKGLNEIVHLKSSEVDWLENVPEHWKEKALKYTCTLNDKALAETTDPEYVINYVDIGSIDKTKGIIKKEQYLFDEAPSRARRIVQDGDILVSTVRTYLRAIAPVINPEENLIVSTGFAVVRPRKIDSDYLSFLLRSKYFVEKVVSLSVGVSYPAINASVLARIKIPIPPTEEQKEITQYLKKETESIDKIVGLTEKHIDKLKEYKTAIISAAVTGKIKVSE
ncbi:restriction endonuclease subunit S [Lentimicrobium sp. L6]|uniref:restriction endonuclease subunit S n=1 Tax=Lentimicrobium sp. L6 TaxID=2735916 RepID=UPI0015541C3F|nr:restriction endonuclease subunit S [Lentimicrobium sp. L6]NPD86434.1 restriction endonuclease subunit S [Lentimicrobium sp. L6]